MGVGWQQMTFLHSMMSSAQGTCASRRNFSRLLKLTGRIKFGEFQDLDRHCASRRIGCAQLLGFPPGSFLGDEWRFEFARVVQGRLALLMILSSFSKSSREGFWPDKVRKNAGSLASSSSFSMTWLGMRPASTAA
jgi:hypothetical protein